MRKRQAPRSLNREKNMKRIEIQECKMELIYLMDEARHAYCCHAKFNHMNDDFEETTIPYKEVVDIMKEHNWDGYLLSEYEGFDKYDLG